MGSMPVPSTRPSHLPARAALSAIVLLALLAGAGCTRAIVNTRKAPDYDKKLDRVLVACPLDHLGKSFAEAFRTRFVEELKKRGTAARFAVLEGALALEKAPTLEQQAKDFQATTALLMHRAGGTVNQYGGVIWANFDSELIDLGLKKRVWRAQVKFHPAMGVEFDAQTLVNEIVRALVADQLIEGPPPAEEKPAQSPTTS
jgi:hypothetical protein